MGESGPVEGTASAKALRSEYTVLSVTCAQWPQHKGDADIDISPRVLDRLSKTTTTFGTSLVVQWLRLPASDAGGTGSIPGGGTKIPHATQLGQKTNKENNNNKTTTFRSEASCKGVSGIHSRDEAGRVGGSCTFRLEGRAYRASESLHSILPQIILEQLPLWAPDSKCQRNSSKHHRLQTLLVASDLIRVGRQTENKISRVWFIRQ